MEPNANTCRAVRSGVGVMVGLVILPTDNGQLTPEVCSVMGSSNEVHVVDALAITGEEGRGSLRKAAGSWQTSFDPSMSEWGNPLLMEYP